MSFLRLVVRALAATARRKRLQLVVAVAMTLGLGCVVAVLVSSSEEANERRSTFCNVEVDPKPPNAEHIWWFEFADEDIGLLEDARRDLEPLGFSLERYYYRCADAPCSEIILRMKKREAYTSASLQAQEAELCDIAKKHRLNQYWGVYLPK